LTVDIQQPGEPAEVFTSNLVNVVSDWLDGGVIGT
jgi:hypothetical protein